MKKESNALAEQQLNNCPPSEESASNHTPDFEEPVPQVHVAEQCMQRVIPLQDQSAAEDDREET